MKLLQLPRAIILFFLAIIFMSTAMGWFLISKNKSPENLSSQEKTKVSESNVSNSNTVFIHPRLRELETWQRPEGPRRVALQIGHMHASEAPDELENLRLNTGTSYRNITEWETALTIAESAKKILEENGIEVDILPVTIPPNYWADIFLSIHADGNENTFISGYKVAAPRHDYTGKSEEFAAMLGQEYKNATQLPEDANITKTMRNYYAFNWRRYDHSIHPMTIAAIIETGFLTNARDRNIIVNHPHQAGIGIANGILAYFESM